MVCVCLEQYVLQAVIYNSVDEVDHFVNIHNDTNRINADEGEGQSTNV